MSSVRRFLPALLLLALAGCGFRPLYGGSGSAGTDVSSRLDQVDIGLIPDRQGQLLRQALEQELQRAGAPGYYRYYLNVSFGLAVQGIGIQADTSNTRNRYIATAHWTLTPEGDRSRIITSGRAESMNAVNVIDNQNFAGTLDAGVMRHQLARALARQIAEELAVYFRNHPDQG